MDLQTLNALGSFFSQNILIYFLKRSSGRFRPIPGTHQGGNPRPTLFYYTQPLFDMRLQQTMVLSLHDISTR